MKKGCENPSPNHVSILALRQRAERNSHAWATGNLVNTSGRQGAGAKLHCCEAEQEKQHV